VGVLEFVALGKTTGVSVDVAVPPGGTGLDVAVGVEDEADGGVWVDVALRT